MNFISEKFGDIIVHKINLSRATFREAEEFKSILADNYSKKVFKMVIDLSVSQFMDSTFLSALVTALKRVSEEGGNLVLVNVHSEALSLIELTGTAKIFQVYKTREEALESFKIPKAS
jgi:anti-anti-sigma factor